MNLKRILSLTIAAVAMVVALLLLSRGRPSRGDAAPRLAPDPVPASPAERADPSLAVRPRQVPAKTGSYLYPEQLGQRFGLNDDELRKIHRGLVEAGVNWIEQKGLLAQARQPDARTLQITVPALPLSEDDIEATVLARLGGVVGVKKATEIWDDPDGRASVVADLELDRVLSPATYTFRKVRDEGNVAKDLSLAYATFDVEWSYTMRQAMPVTSTYQGWTYVDTYGVSLGWNALAKAPPGYFRSEPIVGVASRPLPTPTVNYDRDTGLAEVVNGQYPGSRDLVQLPAKRTDAGR